MDCDILWTLTVGVAAVVAVGIAVWCGSITEQLREIRFLVRKDIKLGRSVMGQGEDVLAHVHAQTGQLNSIQALVVQLRDLAKAGNLDAINAALNDNDAVMAAILANPEPPPTP